MAEPTTAELTPIVLSRATVDDIAVLELGPRDGHRMPAWQPGAHIDVTTPSGLVRQYSLCGDPNGATWRIAVLREPMGRGGSASLYDVAVGDLLPIAGPYNHFEFPARATPPVLFLAGGVGITPIAAMAAAAARAGRDYRLHYSGHAGRMAFVEELRDVHGDRLRLHISEEGGRADIPALFAAADPQTVVYACGPARFLDAAETAATEVGLKFRAERFEAVPLRPPVWQGSFEVELELSGVTLEVPPDRSILQVVEAAGIPVPWSCTEGTCGTCETPVLEGVIDHRDSILTPLERARNDTMFICVSRAACPRLLLEL